MRGVNRQPKKVIRVSQIDLIESDSDDEDVSFFVLEWLTSRLYKLIR